MYTLVTKNGLASEIGGLTEDECYLEASTLRIEDSNVFQRPLILQESVLQLDQQN